MSTERICNSIVNKEEYWVNSAGWLPTRKHGRPHYQLVGTLHRHTGFVRGAQPRRTVCRSRLWTYTMLWNYQPPSSRWTAFPFSTRLLTSCLICGFMGAVDLLFIRACTCWSVITVEESVASCIYVLSVFAYCYYNCIYVFNVFMCCNSVVHRVFSLYMYSLFYHDIPYSTSILTSLMVCFIQRVFSLVMWWNLVEVPSSIRRGTIHSRKRYHTS